MHNEHKRERENPGEADTKTMAEQVAETEALRKQLTEANAQSAENLANWQRAQADFINFKRRLEQDRNEALKYAEMELILSLLPVLDDFQRALNAASQKPCDKAWTDGVFGIERKLRSVLESRGVREIDALDKEFDPNLHEAVMHVPGTEGIVIQEIQKGYLFQDRVVRATRVAVGNGQAGEKEEPIS